MKKLVTNITEKFKSRVIATGYDQNLRFDLIGTYNSIIKFVTIRDIFTLTLSFHWAFMLILIMPFSMESLKNMRI